MVKLYVQFIGVARMMESIFPINYFVCGAVIFKKSKLLLINLLERVPFSKLHQKS